MQLLLLLEAGQHTTAAALAEVLEVSVRTVHRDLDALSQAGVPVYTERGRGGGCRLIDGYRAKVTGLTPAEADALLFSGVPAAAAELGIESLVATAHLKVRAALPRSVRAGAMLAEQRFHIDPPGWFRTHMPDHPQLPDVAAAVWSDRVLTIRYHPTSGNVTSREVEPLGLVLKAGLWYLVARTGGDLRVYRVSRISDIATNDRTFTRPPDFDLAAFWHQWAAEFEADRTSGYRLLLRVHPHALAAVEDLDVGPVEAIDTDDEGWLRVTIHCEAQRWARRAVLELGADAEVLEPVELRHDVAALGRELVRVYG
jgi:predicted DNA-binding transcriptional regulator YafY